MSQRTPGWYWVKVDSDSDWEPAYWTGSAWTHVLDEDPVSDSYFTKIHPARIEDPIEEE